MRTTPGPGGVKHRQNIGWIVSWCQTFALSYQCPGTCGTTWLNPWSFYDNVLTKDEKRGCEKHISVLKILLKSIPQHFPKQPQPFGKFFPILFILRTVRDSQPETWNSSKGRNTIYNRMFPCCQIDQILWQGKYNLETKG